MTDNIELYGNAGLYVNDGNAISFQVGEGEQLFSLPSLAVADGEQLPYNEKVWLGVNGYQVCARGRNNAQCEDVAREISGTAYCHAYIASRLRCSMAMGQ